MSHCPYSANSTCPFEASIQALLRGQAKMQDDQAKMLVLLEGHDFDEESQKKSLTRRLQEVERFVGNEVHETKQKHLSRREFWLGIVGAIAFALASWIILLLATAAHLPH